MAVSKFLCCLSMPWRILPFSLMDNDCGVMNIVFLRSMELELELGLGISGFLFDPYLAFVLRDSKTVRPFGELCCFLIEVSFLLTLSILCWLFFT